MDFLIRFLISAGLLFLFDLYAYQAWKTAFRQRGLRVAYWSAAAVVYAMILVSPFTNEGARHISHFSMYTVGAMILMLVPKMLIVGLMLFEDAARVLQGAALWLGRRMGRDGRKAADQGFLASRRRFVSQAALALAALPFGGILYGIAKGRFDYRVLRHTLYFEDLPAAFDGFTLTQISDLHAGSFDRADKIRYGVELINAQRSDVILFTGDMVNGVASEMAPWIDLFKTLEAPMGKFSVLGNHDYGDYVPWEKPEDKLKNLDDLKAAHKACGFRLLLNENQPIFKGKDYIYIAGVENWGKPPFPQFGDLPKAMDNVVPGSFKVLLSHDPSHFDAQVKQHPEAIQLTLSGHTHGMQFGIEIPGWVKWSPVKWRYPKWAGLYEEAGRFLHVNRGFGYLAFPGRVGIWPEITVIELRKKA